MKKQSAKAAAKTNGGLINFFLHSDAAVSLLVVVLGFLCGAVLIRLVGRNPMGMFKSFFQVLTGFFWNNRGVMKWEIRYIGEWLNVSVPYILCGLTKGFAAYPIINGDSRVLVMVDGKKVNWDHLLVSGDTNAVDVDQIAIGDVERIEIVRGPNSSLYGERAVSGVINIITKRPTAGKPTGSFNIQLGSWGEKRAGVNVSGGDGKNSIKVGVAHERRRDFQYKNAYGEKRTFENSDINRTDYNVGFDHILGNDRLRLEFSRHEGDDGYGVNLSNVRTGASRYQGRKTVIDTGYGVTYMFGSEKEGEGTFL